MPEHTEESLCLGWGLGGDNVLSGPASDKRRSYVLCGRRGISGFASSAVKKNKHKCREY